MKMAEEKIGFGIWTWDLDTSELVWSPGLCRILGVDPHTVIPTIDLYQSLCHPEDQLDFDDAIGIVSSRKLENRTFRIIRPDGVLRHLQSRAEPHLDRNGTTVMLMGVIEDVTDQQALKAEVDAQRSTSRLLARLVDGDVWRAHPDGKLIETTHWMRLTGQTPQQAHDWDRLTAIHPEDRPKFRDAWRDAILRRAQLEFTIRVKMLDGSYQRRHSRAQPLLDVNGAILQWIGYSVAMKEKMVPPAIQDFLTSAQIRAARALLDWTAPELAERAIVSFSTVRRMEQKASSVRQESLRRVRSTFEAAGIMFSADDSGLISISFCEPEQRQLTFGNGAFVEVERERA
ncbi:PAS domain-containing protein [Rhizobium sp. K1/93]|nr:PAS domain-containing protein [Rhizobium sp. L58/93]MBO9188108.1 PAS domain-containing protein [Rhizobium sp. E27B/91]QXZ86347.1 PAS domain-containing protein [Rhizobium sp. K1/93]QXZ92198.1 PAS domain-containing protein [Rhizobium sp. K15/93]